MLIINAHTFVDKTNISSRKIGTSSPFNIKEYKGTVKIHMNRRIFSDNRETKKQIKESTLTIKDMKHIQYIINISPKLSYLPKINYVIRKTKTNGHRLSDVLMHWSPICV